MSAALTFPVGRLRTPLTLLTPVETPDGAGGVTRTFAPGDTLWAALEPASAEARFDAERNGQRVTHTVIVRIHPQIRPGYRLSDEARTFDIRTVRDADGRGRLFLIAAEEIDP